MQAVMRSADRSLLFYMVKNRGFRHGALAVSLGLVAYTGLRVWHLYQVREKRRLMKEDKEFFAEVSGLIDEQVSLCFETAGEFEVEDAFEPDADALRALWGM